MVQQVKQPESATGLGSMFDDIGTIAVIGLTIFAVAAVLFAARMIVEYDRRLKAAKRREALTIETSEEQMMQILKRMPLAIIAMSAQDGNRVLFTNEQADALLAGKNPLMLPFLGENGINLPPYKNPFRLALSGQIEHDRTKIRLARADGRIGYIEISSTFLDEEDEKSDILFMMNDVSEKVVAETALNQAQKLEAIGQLTGGVAHDFNNLLTPIVGGLDMLRKEKNLTPRAKRVIEAALQASQRATTLIQRLLAFARRQTLHISNVDAKELVFGIEDLIRRTLEPNIDFKIEATESMGVKVDASQLELAVLNLVINSRDALPEGGSIGVGVECVNIDGHEGLDIPNGEYVCISVTDNGSGMSDDTIKKAIEPFFSTKGIGKGTGLGLSMAHGLAAQSGGELRITSAVGLGTRIDMFFPKVEIEEKAEDGNEIYDNFNPQQLTILVVDDEEIVRQATTEVLRDLGHDVIQASSGMNALGILRKTPEINLVVTDHLMPGMTGANLATEIYNSYPRLPVMIITGYTNLDELPKNVPFLSKPFKQREMAKMIEYVTTKHRRS